MDTVDQKFIRLIGHKLDSNLNLVEKGSEHIGAPQYIAIPESTFEKIGFDRQDIYEMIFKYHFLKVIPEYKIITEPPTMKFIDMDSFDIKAQYLLKLKPNEWENVYALEILTWRFEQVWKELFSDSPSRKISYNTTTGVGTLRKKTFKLKDNQPEFTLFEELYRSPNEPVKRDRVLKILKCKESTSATLVINDLVKKIRTRTGLTTKELVLNNGNVTLSI